MSKRSRLRICILIEVLRSLEHSYHALCLILFSFIPSTKVVTLARHPVKRLVSCQCESAASIIVRARGRYGSLHLRVIRVKERVVRPPTPRLGAGEWWIGMWFTDQWENIANAWAAWKKWTDLATAPRPWFTNLFYVPASLSKSRKRGWWETAARRMRHDRWDYETRQLK